MQKLIVSDLYIYPIKSCGGIRLTSSEVEIRGLKYDRRWVLIDHRNKFITQRNNSKLALVRCEINEDSLKVTIFNTNKNLVVPFIDKRSFQRENVTIWEDECEALIYDEAINAWFSNQLGMQCRLAYMPDDINRQVDLRYAQEGDITSFSDGYPILMVCQSSLDYLNGQLALPIPMIRFRPNIVFQGGEPHIEDKIRKCSINSVMLEGVKPCARCTVPSIDQDSLFISDEPTATLATYRFTDKKILFGQNVLVKNEGTIKVGDELSIVSIQ